MRGLPERFHARAIGCAAQRFRIARPSAGRIGVHASSQRVEMLGDERVRGSPRRRARRGTSQRRHRVAHVDLRVEQQRQAAAGQRRIVERIEGDQQVAAIEAVGCPAHLVLHRVEQCRIARARRDQQHGVGKTGVDGLPVGDPRAGKSARLVRQRRVFRTDEGQH
jgi:hypothetical protein